MLSDARVQAKQFIYKFMIKSPHFDLPWANWILHPVSAWILAICSPPLPITGKGNKQVLENTRFVSCNFCRPWMGTCGTHLVQPSCPGLTNFHWQPLRDLREAQVPFQGSVDSYCLLLASDLSETLLPPLLVLLFVCNCIINFGWIAVNFGVD